MTLVFTTELRSQENIKAELEAQAIGTTNEQIPFWMRSNQYGSIPTFGVSGSILARAYKTYNNANSPKIDWGTGFEGRLNAGNNTKLLLIEAYAKIKIGTFQFKAGRSKDVMGLNGDTLLSSGNFAVSGNALGIPKIEISIPKYITLPFFDKLIAVKGSFAHGWAGKMDVKDTILYGPNPTVSRVEKAGVYLHQKSLYLRLGKPAWRLKLFGGFNHQVFWGNEKEIYGDAFTLSEIETFFYVSTGKAYGDNKIIPNSKIGNQLGSIDIGAWYDFRTIRVGLYRQNIYDVGALSHLANIKDGLNGICFENKQTDNHKTLNWNKILIEFLYTKNQAGELNSKYTKSGDEDYYNNYFYTAGWSYNDVGLGTPFISTKSSVREGQPSDPKDFFINNRVVAFHAGFIGSIKSTTITSKLSFSQNYGTFGTSEIGHSLGSIRIPPQYGIFDKVSQFSAFVKVERPTKNDFKLGLTASLDQGRLLNNALGLSFSIVKSIF